MDLDDLKIPANRHGYVYHTVFTRPTDGRKFHYIGQHINKTLNRKYCGSGRWLRSLRNKYRGQGSHIHVKILNWAYSQEELNFKEIMFIVFAKELFGKDCINIDYRESIGRLSARTRAKLSAAHTGKTLSPEHRAKIAKASRGNKSNTGRTLSEEHRRNISEGGKGRVQSEETRAKIRAAHMGMKLSEEAKQKRRITLSKLPTVKCPHCPVTGRQGGNMNRFHFDNCKSLA